jgi:hypothetical protein
MAAEAGSADSTSTPAPESEAEMVPSPVERGRGEGVDEGCTDAGVSGRRGEGGLDGWAERRRLAAVPRTSSSTLEGCSRGG